jgi:hypothetical protein
MENLLLNKVIETGQMAVMLASFNEFDLENIAEAIIIDRGQFNMEVSRFTKFVVIVTGRRKKTAKEKNL